MRKIEFVVKMTNGSVVSNLCLEKRIIPRCNVINAFMSKGSEIPPMGFVFGM